MRKICYVNDLREYLQHERNTIVTATAAQCDAIRGYHPDKRVYDVNAFLNEFMRKCDREWDETEEDLRDYVVLKDVIDRETRGYDAKKALSLQRNAKEIWNAIQLLTEANVKPEDLPTDAPEQVENFGKIWRGYIARGPKKNEKIEKLNEMRGKADMTAQILTAHFLEEDHAVRSIMLVGFYFITPLQELLFRIIENAGAMLVFINERDAEMPFCGEIYEKTFAGADTEEIRIGNTKDPLGRIINGKEIVRVPIKVRRYGSEMAFATAMKEPLLSDAEIYTPDRKECMRIFQDYIPEVCEKKKTISYPVGQYIHTLNTMWDDFGKRVVLSMDKVIRCFATGWVDGDGVEARDLIYELKRLEPYFSDCETIGDWQGRMASLKEARECLSVFEVKDGENRRWHDMLGDPFKYLSFYAVTDETLDKIRAGLERLIHDATYLFSGEERTTLAEHFAKMTSIIMDHMDEKEGTDEEEIAKQLIDELEAVGGRDIECPVSAVTEAVSLLVGDKFEDPDLREEQKVGLSARIRPLSAAESSRFTNYGQDIYLLFADEFTLPGPKAKLPWPLTDELLDRIEEKVEPETRQLVRYMRGIVDNRPLSNRYLFSRLLAGLDEKIGAKIHIYWLKEKGGKVTGPTPYLRLLDPEGQALKDADPDAENERIPDLRECIDDEENTAPAPKGNEPEEVRKDYALCPMRYVYSYRLNERPEYTSQFHTSFALTALIKAFGAEAGEKRKDEVAEKLFELFPFLRNAEKRQSYDYAGRPRDEGPYVYDGAEYPAARGYVHYLNNEIRRYASDPENNERPDQNMICMYCPYTDVCRVKYGEMGEQDG